MKSSPARYISLSISESLQELRYLLHHTPSPRSQERLQMLFWLKSGQVSTRGEIASRLGRSVASVGNWLRLYRQGGLEALLEIKPPPGPPSALSDSVLDQLRKRLESPQGFSSYKEIQRWLAEQFELHLAYSTVHKIVHYQLQAEVRRPRPYSYQPGEKELKAIVIDPQSHSG